MVLKVVRNMQEVQAISTQREHKVQVNVSDLDDSYFFIAHL